MPDYAGSIPCKIGASFYIGIHYFEIFIVWNFVIWSFAGNMKMRGIPSVKEANGSAKTKAVSDTVPTHKKDIRIYCDYSIFVPNNYSEATFAILFLFLILLQVDVMLFEKF